jgi:hypothetical protein
MKYELLCSCLRSQWGQFHIAFIQSDSCSLFITSVPLRPFPWRSYYMLRPSFHHVHKWRFLEDKFLLQVILRRCIKFSSYIMSNLMTVWLCTAIEKWFPTFTLPGLTEESHHKSLLKQVSEFRIRYFANTSVCIADVDLVSRCLKRVRVTLRLTVSQSVCLGVEPRLGLMTRYSFWLKVTVLSIWGALSDDRSGLSFVSRSWQW